MSEDDMNSTYLKSFYQEDEKKLNLLLEEEDRLLGQLKEVREKIIALRLLMRLSE